MLLQRLERDADRIVGSLPPPMYDLKPVRWIIDLDTDGAFRGFVRTTGDGGPRDKGRAMVVPHLSGRSGTKAPPILLADRPDYTLGLDATDERVRRRHDDYLALVQACVSATGSEAASAVLAFLQSLPGAGVAVPPELTASDWITFRVGGAVVVDEPAVREFWASVNGAGSAGTGDGDCNERACVVCGNCRQIPTRLPVHIRGIPGKQATYALVSAEEEFESYGLKRGATAGVCHECGERLGKALNELIKRDATSLRVGPLVFIFWTKEDVGFDFVGALSEPTADLVKSLLTSHLRGSGVVSLDETAFHGTALSASGGRAVVREWLSITVGEAKRNLARWFRLIAQVDASGAEGLPLGLYRLAKAPYRDPSKQMAPQLPTHLVQAALHGRALPSWVLSIVVARCKAGPVGRQREVVTYERAALLKAALVSGEQGREAYMSQLDASDTSVAYLCGRALAVLEAIQRRAIPRIKATVVDKFFASASTAPASVYGRLLADARPHLSKLRKSEQTRAAAEALERRLEEVLAPIDPVAGFPATLALRDQALFSLGYYHQRAADRAAATAAKAAKGATAGNVENEMGE